MDKLFLLVLSITILLSCKKNISITNNLYYEIAGVWELEKNICGECLTQVTTFLPGNGNIIVLAANGKYERKKQDTLLFSGSYTLQEKVDCYERSSNLSFSTNDTLNKLSGNFVNLQNGKLIFSTPNCYADGASSIYKRIE